MNRNDTATERASIETEPSRLVIIASWVFIALVGIAMFLGIAAMLNFSLRYNP